MHSSPRSSVTTDALRTEREPDRAERAPSTNSSADCANPHQAWLLTRPSNSMGRPYMQGGRACGRVVCARRALQEHRGTPRSASRLDFLCYRTTPQLTRLLIQPETLFARAAALCVCRRRSLVAARPLVAGRRSSHRPPSLRTGVH